MGENDSYNPKFYTHIPSSTLTCPKMTAGCWCNGVASGISGQIPREFCWRKGCSAREQVGPGAQAGRDVLISGSDDFKVME